ncbi:four-carbon acid sugar kinase family protein [Plantactinospora sp. GCM10030261]|uniref:four-carbon acid sugar kinase family protein n=1 Tax=Plantactinospora sp. GCM10030261 TaxID=3273420 RepID=UPI003615B41F
MTRPWLGVVADDLTGAGDLADAVCEAGGSAIVVVGTPGAPPPDCDAAVVALKSRTAPRDRAVAESLAAGRWLVDAGCTTLYQKYCSTFDSTDDGNIGPVADALADLVAGDGTAPVSVGTPATPRVGRTVYQGHLFVGRQLLSESPLRDHPLTPMRDPDLVRVLGRQTAARVALVDRATVAAGPDRVATAIEAARRDGARHVLADAVGDDDLDTIAAALLRGPTRPLVGGAAGLAAALARARSGATAPASTPGPASGGSGAVASSSAPAGSEARASSSAPAGNDLPAARVVPVVPAGRRLILSGSCSARTREQVDTFPGPRIPLSPVDLDVDFAGAVAGVLAALDAAYRSVEEPVLVSSSADPAQVAEFEVRLGAGRSAELLEAATAEIAVRAVADLAVRRLLVAGGETSGAVVHGLGLGALRVGPAVGPGLPWMVPDPGPRLALLLKSGNFGDPDLFTTAWHRCP